MSGGASRERALVSRRAGHLAGHPEGWRARPGARPRTNRRSFAFRVRRAFRDSSPRVDALPREDPREDPSSPTGYAPGESTSPPPGTPSRARAASASPFGRRARSRERAPSRGRARRAPPPRARPPRMATPFLRRAPRRRGTPRDPGDAACPGTRGAARRSPRRARWRRARGGTRGRGACAAEPRGPRAACHSSGHTHAQRQPARRSRRSRRR